MNVFKRVRNIFSHIPKKLAATFGVLAAVLIPAALFAWGPSDRPTYTIEKPADHVTFNSITNNPNYGDERNFTSAKLSSEGSTAWRDIINVTGNNEYSVNIYVHNNAAANLGLVAKNTRAQVTWSTGLAKQIQLDGVISADNAVPVSVWDQVIFKSDSKNFKLVYVAGSARYYNNANPANGFAISDNVVKAGGALLGYNSMNGEIPGCFQYAGILNLKVQTVVETDNSFTMEKKVRLNGATEWSKSVTAQPGQKVDYQISYKNTGELTQKGVIVRDQLPTGVAYNNGTTTLRNGTYNEGNGMTLTSNAITSSGVGIGNYLPAAAAYVRFTATMPAEDKLVCGVNTLVNRGFVTADSVTKEDSASVTINKSCPEPVKEFTCDRLNITKVNRTSFDFTTNYTVKNTAYRNISYTIAGNGVYDTKISTAADGKLAYQQLTPGTYTVVATLHAADGSNTNVNCQGQFTVDPAPVPSEAICKILTANPSVIKTGESVAFTVTPEYTGNVQVVGSYIDYGDGVKTNPSNVYRYSHIYNKAGTYKAKAYINFIVDGAAKNDVSSVACEKPITVSEPEPDKCTVPGKEDLEANDPNCKEDEDKCTVPGKEDLEANDPNCKEDEDKCTVPGKEDLEANDPNCKEDEDKCTVPGKEDLEANDPNCKSDVVDDKCEVPGKENLSPEDPNCRVDGGGKTSDGSGPSYLPKTGFEAFGVLGLGSMATAGAYYVASRRALKK